MRPDDDRALPLTLPGSNIYGQTFFKIVRHGLPDGATGTYRYTSELEEILKNSGGA